MKMNDTVVYRIPFCHQQQYVPERNHSYEINELSGSGESTTWSIILVTKPELNGGSIAWEMLTKSCQLSSIIVGAVAAVLFVLGIVLNSLSIASARNTEPKPLAKKSDSAAITRRKALQVSLKVSSYFRISLAVSFILASVLLLPLIGLNTYQLLFTNNEEEPLTGIRYSEIYRMVSCVIFHIAISSSIYTMLGSVVERWTTISSLDPENFLQKVNNMMNTPSNKIRNCSKNFDAKPTLIRAHRKPFAIAYLILTWIVSLAFGLLCVVYSKVRFLVFGNIYYGNEEKDILEFFSFIQISRERSVVTLIIYIVFLFLPLIIFIFALLITLWSLLKIQANAKKIDTYDEAKFKGTFSQLNGEIPFNHKLMQVTQSNPKLEIIEERRGGSSRMETEERRRGSSRTETEERRRGSSRTEREERRRGSSRTEREERRRGSSRTEREEQRRGGSRTEREERRRGGSRTETEERESERPNRVAEYSHRAEHERQVTLNCQESELNGIQTDSIQVSNESNGEAQTSIHNNAPLPPEWLKFSSLTRVRYSDNTAIQVVDLASSSMSVSIDSSRCYFGETNETRATLITTSTLSLLLLPVCALIAIDIFATAGSIFHENTVTDRLASDSSNLNPIIFPSLATSFLLFYIFGGNLQFFLFYGTSELFKRGAKRMCCSKKQHHAAQKLNKGASFRPVNCSPPRDGQRSTKYTRNSSKENGNGKDMQRNRWTSSRRPPSLDIEAWRPEERPTSEAFPEQPIDIDRRFELDDEDE